VYFLGHEGGGGGGGAPGGGGGGGEEGGRGNHPPPLRTSQQKEKETKDVFSIGWGEAEILAPAPVTEETLMSLRRPNKGPLLQKR